MENKENDTYLQESEQKRRNAAVVHFFGEGSGVLTS
jgi:hypothetical protein